MQRGLQASCYINMVKKKHIIYIQQTFSFLPKKGKIQRSECFLIRLQKKKSLNHRWHKNKTKQKTLGSSSKLPQEVFLNIP